MVRVYGSMKVPNPPRVYRTDYPRDEDGRYVSTSAESGTRQPTPL